MNSKLFTAAVAASTLALAGCSSTGSSDIGYVGAPSPSIPQYQQNGTTGLANSYGTTQSLALTRNENGIDIAAADGSTTLRLPYRDSAVDEATGYTGSIYAENYTEDGGPSGHFAAALDGQYGTLIGWGRVNGNTEEVNGFAVVGERTQNMPVRHLAVYEGVWLSNIPGEELGTFRADADFVHNEIRYRIDGGVMTGAADIKGNTFTGDLSASDGLTTGRVDGQFFGPHAQEIGGVAELNRDGQRYSGGFAGGPLANEY